MPIKPAVLPNLSTGTVNLVHACVGTATSSNASTARKRAKDRAVNLVASLQAQYAQAKLNRPPVKIGDMGPNVFETGKSKRQQTGIAVHVRVEHTIYVAAWWVRRP